MNYIIYPNEWTKRQINKQNKTGNCDVQAGVLDCESDDYLVNISSVMWNSLDMIGSYQG